MRRLSVIVGILGLAWAAALPASAQTTKLFGTTYNVVKESRAQTYKNGKTVVLPESGNRKAGLFFEEGADPSQDRLWVVCAIPNDDAVTGHQFYALKGADANGVFSAASAELEEFFGGNQNRQRGGRPINVMVINRENAGVKQDRNVITMTFWDTDTIRLFDLDTMNGVAGDNDESKPSDAVLSRPRRSQDESAADPNLPFGDFNAFAPGPNGTVVVIAGDDDRAGAEIGVWDVKKDDAFNVLTNLTTVTQNSTKPIPAEAPNGDALQPHAAIRYSADEYWFLHSWDPGGDNDSRENNLLVRMKLTFPANLASAGPGSIKAEILGIEDLRTNAGLKGEGDGGMFGMAVGREVAPGLRRLYFADWFGNLYTATPVP